MLASSTGLQDRYLEYYIPEDPGESLPEVFVNEWTNHSSSIRANEDSNKALFELRHDLLPVLLREGCIVGPYEPCCLETCRKE
jgi:hypothetical protein